MNYIQPAMGYVLPYWYAYEPNTSAAAEPAISSTLKRRLFQGFLDLIGIVLTFVIFAIVLFAAEPRIRYITCNMDDIVFPKKEDVVAVYVVGLYGFLVPTFGIVLVEAFNAALYRSDSDSDKRSRFRRFAITAFHGLSLFLFGCGITLLLTEIGKRSVGRLRPHFLAVCNPDLTQIDCNQAALTGNLYKSIWTGGSFCRGAAADIEEARLSFPSGHSSFAAYTMLFLIIYLEARLVALYLRYAKVLVQAGLFIVAFYTSLSRVADYAHRGSDVIGGAVLGAGVALAMTLVVGRVLWVYESREEDLEIDLRERAKPGQQPTNTYNSV